MKKWEYICQRIAHDITDIERMLNRLGKDGWELTAAGKVATNYSASSETLTLFFKREIPEPQGQDTVVERRVIGKDGKMRIESPEPQADSKFFDSDVRSPVPLSDQEDYYVDDPRR